MREYKVRQTLSEIIEIEVEAESEEEAIAIALRTDEMEWGLIWSTTELVEVEQISEHN